MIVEIHLLFILVTLLDRVFENVTNTEDWVRYTLEVDLSHLYFKNLNLSDFLRDVSVIFFILLDNRSVNFISSLEDCFNILLNVLNNSLNLSFKVRNCLVNESNRLLNFNSLIQNVIVTFVLLKFQRFVYKLEVFIDLLNLFTIKLLGSDKVLFDFFLFVLDLVQKSFGHLQKVVNFCFTISSAVKHWISSSAWLNWTTIT